MGARHLAARPATYRSDSGRPLVGGGGIAPDVRLDPDTLTTREQSFGKALDGRLEAFRDAVTATALQVRRQGTIRSESFAVDQGMMDAVRRELEQRGVRLADSTYRGGESIVRQQLGYELARYIFGAAAERRRRVSDDRQIGRAVTLLHEAQTPSALLGLASARTSPAH
jgi:hypothetical protein